MGRKSARTLWADKLAGKSTDSSNSSLLPVGTNRFKGLVLGIDPSLRGTGIALMEFDGKKQTVLVKSETVRLETKLSQPECIARIFLAVENYIDRYEIRHVAIEQTIFVQNFQTAMLLGSARGAAIAAAAIKGLPVFEYAPLRIKQAVVGFGRASKEQLARTVANMVGLKDPLPLDEADAAGTALCHVLTHKEV
jgi:crossover junction endodeoxyribonuclease RuvC